jgi:hypothetical protein
MVKKKYKMDAPAGDIQLGVLKILKKTKKALRLF